jgi:hypothetical protein
MTEVRRASCWLEAAPREVWMVRAIEGWCHVAHIPGKLGVANRIQAVARARELGLVP